MRDALTNFNRVTTFFLTNYETRFKLYQQKPINKEQLRSINKGERKIVTSLKKDIDTLNRHILAKQPALHSKFVSFNSTVSGVLQVLDIFLAREQEYLTGHISEEALKKDYLVYQGAKNNIPSEQIESLLNDIVSKDDSHIKKILRNLDHVRDIRNMWIGPAVFVELFGLMYSSWNALSKDADWVHTSASDFLEFYLIVVFLMISKLPDHVMKVYDVLLEKVK